MYPLQETQVSSKITNSLNVKGWKKILPANNNQKRVRLVKKILSKINFKSKKHCKRHRRVLYISTVSIQQEDISTVNICYKRTPK